MFEGDASSLAASLPLFLVGVGCLGFGLFVRVDNPHAVIDRIPLWLPLIAIGFIAFIGGTLSFFASPGDEPEDELLVTERRSSIPAPSPRPVPVPRADHTEPARVPSTPPSESRPRPTSTASPSRPPLGAVAAPPPRPVPGSSFADELDDLAGLPSPDSAADSSEFELSELDSIDVDLHPTRPRTGARGPAGVAPPSLDSDADSIEAVLADLPEAPRVSPVERRPVPHRPAASRRRPYAHCVECGSPVPETEEPGTCLGCEEPLCAECRGRSIAEGKPNLCVFCSVLDESHPKAAGASVSGTERS
ncbi:MAG: hypothetical protein L3J81_04740 [Thermoplasmata archaeon]|nr:hypothetical protein [Thermoplasmata archaeon]